MIDLGEAAGCAGEQHDPRFGLKNLAQSPSRVRVEDVSEHHVQVLDQQNQPLVLAVGEVQQGGKAALAKGLVVGKSAQVCKGAMQVGGIFSVRCLIGQAG